MSSPFFCSRLFVASADLAGQNPVFAVDQVPVLPVRALKPRAAFPHDPCPHAHEFKGQIIGMTAQNAVACVDHVVQHVRAGIHGVMTDENPVIAAPEQIPDAAVLGPIFLHA